MRSAHPIVAISLAVIVVSHLRAADAQNSTVTCESSSSWMNNENGQDPCVIASNLEAMCTRAEDVAIVVLPLPKGNVYTGPLQSDANSCVCSSVVYSLVAACALCQGGSYVTWSAWSQNCPRVWIASLPEGIPSGIAVPAWAFLNVVTGDNFDETAARSDLNQPDSTSPAPAATVTKTVTATPSASALGDAGSTKASSIDAGAISGGVVGGIVGLGLLALLFYVVFGRRRSVSRPEKESRSNLDDTRSEKSWSNETTSSTLA